MTKLIPALLVCLLLLPNLVSAQDGDELQCDSAAISAATEQAVAQLQQAESEEPAVALQSIAEVRAALADLEAQCTGLVFTGDAGTVHGPVEIPEGIYRASVTTMNFFSMEQELLEGECGEWLIFNEMAEGEFTAEAIFRSAGCTVLFETSNVHAPYTLWFEKVD